MKIPNGLCVIFFTQNFEETKYFKKVAKEYSNSEIKFFISRNYNFSPETIKVSSIIFFNNRVEILRIPSDNYHHRLDYETNNFFLEQKSNFCDRIRIAIELLLNWFEEK